jgi:hypothetical protein
MRANHKTVSRIMRDDNLNCRYPRVATGQTRPRRSFQTLFDWIAAILTDFFDPPTSTRILSAIHAC